MARVDTLAPVPFPLPDPGVVLQHVWITQAGRDFAISPTRLGFVQQSRIAPVNPFSYQLWWDTSALPAGPAVLRAYVNNVWAELGPFGDQFGNVTVPGTLTVTGGKINGANAQGYLEIASNLQIDGGTIAGPNAGPLATTGNFTVGGNLTTNGTTTLKGATTVTGGLTTDTLTATGNTTIGGSLTTTTITITGAGTGGGGGFTANTGTFSGFVTIGGTLTANGGITYTGGAIGDTLTLNGTAPEITLNNTTSNCILWSSAGISPPALAAYSPGTKLLLSQTRSASTYDTGIGLQFNAMWFAAGGFAFYGMAGSPALLNVDTGGNLAITSPNVSFSGNTNVGGNLTVSGTTTLNGQTNAQNINAAAITAQNGLTVNGGFTSNGNANVVGNLTASGTTQLGHTNVYGDFGVSGNVGVQGNLTVSGTVTSGGTGGGTGGGAVSFDSVTVTHGVSVGGDLGVTGNTTMAGNLTVQGTSQFANMNANSLTTGTINIPSSASALAINGTIVLNQTSGQPAALITNGSINCIASPGQADALFCQGDLGVTDTGVASAWILWSDVLLKTDITGYDRGIASIIKLRPVGYRIKGSQTRSCGLIAGDVEQAIPEAVGEHKGLKTIDPMVLIATLINTVRELDQKVGTMRNELERIQSRLG